MFIKWASKKAGLSPGTLMYVGEEKEEKIKIKIIDYNEHRVDEKEVESIDDCLPF